MARARVGGARSKVKGAVGDVVYQITKDGDGDYQQTVYRRNRERVNNNTRPQAIARMIMGQIERMFHVLPDIIRDAYYQIDPGTMAFQHFAKINYPLLKADFVEHYTEGQVFDWQSKRQVYAPAGEWLLCDGTLPAFAFDSGHFTQGLNNAFDLTWQFDNDRATFADLLAKMHVMIGDTLILFVYKKRESTGKPEILRFTTTPNASIPLDTLLNDTYENDLFQFDTQWGWENGWLMGYNQFSMGFNGENIGYDYRMACAAFLIVRPNEHGTLFSSSRFFWLQPYLQGVNYYRQSPNNALIAGGWLNP